MAVGGKQVISDVWQGARDDACVIAKKKAADAASQGEHNHGRGWPASACVGDVRYWWHTRCMCTHHTFGGGRVFVLAGRQTPASHPRLLPWIVYLGLCGHHLQGVWAFAAQAGWVA